jgi:hypothetical protein
MCTVIVAAWWFDCVHGRHIGVDVLRHCRNSNKLCSFVGLQFNDSNYVIYNRFKDIFFSWRDNTLVDLGLLIHEVCCSRSHTRHTTVGRTPLDE